MAVYRVYVEKKSPFDVEAQGVLSELRSLLGIEGLTGLRLLNRYDVEGLDEALMRRALALNGDGMTINFPDKLTAALEAK